MSDQVIFTKDEVEKIKEALGTSARIAENECNKNAIIEIYSALDLVDSPRPRMNKVLPMSMLCEICDTSDRMENDNNNWDRSNFVLAFGDIAKNYGFDVED